MSASLYWLKINKTGELNIDEFQIFLEFVNIKLEKSEVKGLVSIFGNRITYKQFKKLLNIELK